MTSANVRTRLRLMRTIVETIERRGLKQREAAELFGTTQPRVSDIVRGKVEEVSLDSLVNMLAAAGIDASLSERPGPRPHRADPVVEAYKKDIDRTLIREALRRTPTERVQALEELRALSREAARAGRRQRLGRR